MRLPLARIALCVLSLPACRHAPETDPRMVSEWMHALYGVVRAERLSPPVAARFMGYASIALYEGLAASDPTVPTLAKVLNGHPTIPTPRREESYDPTLVATRAEQVVLDSLLAEGLPSSRGALGGLSDSLVTARLALGVTQQVAARSKTLGEQIGLAMVVWSHSDGYDSTRGRNYVPPVGPGFWINDSPVSLYSSQNQSGATELVAPDNPSNTLKPGSTGDRGLIVSRAKRAGLKNLPAVNMAGATEPYWGQIRPFMLTSWDECPLPDPPAYGTTPAAPLYQQAKAVYDTKKGLTPEQLEIALYWADNPGETGTPSGHWTAIAAQMIPQRKLGAGSAARLFALTAAAQSDAFIASWGYKYRFNLIRPRTFIRRLIDPNWEPQISTPPFPEHPAGHSTQSAAAAAVLTALLGELPFDDSTGLAIGHQVRRFTSFDAASREAGQSRIYGGIHYPSGNEGGHMLGACVGQHLVDRAPALRLP